MVDAFISYTHADEAYKNEFLQHLEPLRHEGLIRLWHDGMLQPGEHLDPLIQAELATAELIILLISAAFIASRYCYEEEMQRAFERQRQDKVRVVALILRPCQWQAVPIGEEQKLSDFLALPKDGLPISKWADRDDGFNNAVSALRELLTQKTSGVARSASRAPVQPVRAAQRNAEPTTRSAWSNSLSLTTKITDRDRALFLKQAFTYAASTFEERLDQLTTENARLQTDFERVDSRTFIATAYVDGNSAGGCTIFVGGDFMKDAICLSYDTGLSRSGMNDWLAVETDTGSLRFKASNMSALSRSSHGELDEQGAANYLWEAFLSHVQSRIR